MKSLTLTSADVSGVATRRGSKRTRIPEILAAAARLFAREGYAAFSTRAVAAEAGIRLSTLQHYFGTRDDLLRETIGALIERHHARIRQVIEDKVLQLEARLEALLDATLDEFSRAETAGFWVEVWTMARHEAFARELQQRAYEDGTRYVESLIAALHPGLPASDCAVRATLISMQIEGLLVLVQRGQGDLRHGVLGAARNVCRAIAMAPL